MEIGLVRTRFSDLRILVVEDQAEARAHLREMLMDLGISQIYEAADGQNGLRLADHALGFIDIILCDWNMPSMSGLELLQAIRKKGEPIPFLMITGRSDETSMMSAKAAGCPDLSANLMAPRRSR